MDTKFISINLAPVMHDKLAGLKKALGLTRSDVIRQLINEGYDKHVRPDSEQIVTIPRQKFIEMNNEIIDLREKAVK